MMNRLFLISTILLVWVWFNYGLAISCPAKTTSGYNYINFVGKLAGLGGDTAVKVWFEYGTQKNNLNIKTKALNLTEPTIFCLRATKLRSCTTYYYRAAAQNSAGINYGEIKTIQTLCLNNKNKSKLFNNPTKTQKREFNWVVF